MKTFNEHFSISEDVTEHLNIPLENDLEAFIDPYLIVNNMNKTLAKRMYLRSKSFLKALNRKYIVPNDKKNGVSFLSYLTEANEYHLGYSPENKGKGIGKTKAETIFNSLRANQFAKAGISITNEAHNVLLLIEGIGQDNMSDTLANICRDILAEYTYALCIKYGIPVYNYEICYYDHHFRKWSTKDVKLPSYKGNKIILVPQFLCSGTRIYPNHYNWFVASNCISKDILSGKISVNDCDNYFEVLQNGTKRAIIKNINKNYRKPKAELIDFVKLYNNSLLEFKDHAKENYPCLAVIVTYQQVS